MSKRKKIEDFVNKLEFFYRNFGNKWNLKDFIDIRNKNDEIILSECLKDLEKKGIVKILSDNHDFEIIDLPSNKKE
ncbi:hypothetical protein JoomaDRAFT_2073 [Galbibacter orientalis DSM 19592]|uniref:Uncharacterized protein n=1 Tax=Galbibacter orientalis DSM 19592 TaxID=926559 RepID=I3C624_9FLAO|nr:hypothetical protein [Galbibacter orientalis]EIJ39067.1 hypothetical protein JoomaDRAFT_2073 [Galbibacter orientalis DSM 19592]